MNQQAAEKLRVVISAWKARTLYTYHQKNGGVAKSPVVSGEVILRFNCTLQGFFCQGLPIEITLDSKSFHTTTLSESPLGDNPDADKYRLEKFLNDFDQQFEAYVSDKFAECSETIFTSDPAFF